MSASRYTSDGSKYDKEVNLGPVTTHNRTPYKCEESIEIKAGNRRENQSRRRT